MLNYLNIIKNYTLLFMWLNFMLLTTYKPKNLKT